ncbi:ImmA/IrrE family metallo-endopeptidase [Bartonella sp. DGB2]|uniref:ImmA/IrrE family metallo-endopeptidase n=1 Tax=Bartonella sp. DGB2 TaxID=3388426 RepID=UPI00399029C0
MQPNYVKAKNTALGLLKTYGISSPPVNVMELARNENIKLKFVSFTSEEAINNVSGFYDAEEHAIYINKDEYPLRQMFTIAHELGHALLHKNGAASNAYKVLMRQDLNNENAVQEKEANCFAAHLLVPRFMLDEFYQQPLPTLSKIFLTSIPMLKNRLEFEYGIG